MVRPSRIGELDESDALQGLTSRQYRFAVLSFTGMADAEAYRQAYNSREANAETLGKMAHAVARNPKVQAKVLELRAKFDSQTTLAPLLTKQFVLNGIMQIALNADKPAVRLRAYELLGKVIGVDLFRDTQKAEPKQRTIEEIDRELRERVAALKPILDATARRIEPEPPGVSGAAKARDRRRKPKIVITSS